MIYMRCVLPLIRYDELIHMCVYVYGYIYIYIYIYIYMEDYFIINVKVFIYCFQNDIFY